jgi:HEPN domain-containing protein
MKPETAEWIAKAEGNWSVAGREMQAAQPVWNIVCFLAQQCAEQYLKAFLEEQGITFRKTHDLVVLLSSTSGSIKELHQYSRDLAYLGTLGIAARYPGTDADQDITEDALRIAAVVRAAVRAKLGVD